MFFTILHYRNVVFKIYSAVQSIFSQEIPKNTYLCFRIYIMLLFHMLKFCIIKGCLNLEREPTSNATISSTTFLKSYLVSVLPGKDMICPLYQWHLITHFHPYSDFSTVRA